MFHLRPAYVPPMVNRFHAVAVGAEALVAPAPVQGGTGRTALYVGVPALGLGVLAHLAGWGTPAALLAVAAGGLGGLIASRERVVHPAPPAPLALPAKKETCLVDLDAATREPVEKAIRENDGHSLLAYADQARGHGWECAAREIEARAKDISDSSAAAEKDRRAKLDVTAIVAEADAPLALRVASALSLFTVAAVSGAEMDYGSALFPVKPTDETVKLLDDLAVSLGEAGYVKAQSQITAASGAARIARDAPPPGP